MMNTKSKSHFKSARFVLRALLVFSLLLVANQVHAQGRGLALPMGYDDSPREARYRKALEYFNRAVAAERANRAQEAVRLFDRALRFDPESREIRFSFANSLIRVGNLEQARIEALQISPYDARSLRLISALYERAGMPDSTLFYMRLLVDVDSTDFESVRNLADYYKRNGQSDSAVAFLELLGERTSDFRSFAGVAALKIDIQDFSGALEAFTRSVELNSTIENITSISGISDMQSLLGMPVKQRITLQQLLELDSTNIPTHRRFMEYYSRRGFYDSSLVHAKAEVRLQPQDQNAVRRLGILAFNADSLDVAEEQFNLLLSIGDTDISSFFFLGRIYQERGNHRYAILNYKGAVRAADTLAEGWLGLASVYSDLDSLAQEIDTYSEALRKVKEPIDRLRLYFSLGAAHERSSDFESSQRAFLGALAIDSMHAPSLNFYGYMLIERNERIPYAKDLIQRALISSPGNGAYIDSYAWALYQEGDFPQALDSLRVALRAIGDDPAVLDHIGDVFNQLNQADSAKVYWRRALQIDSTNSVIRTKLEQQD